MPDPAAEYAELLRRQRWVENKLIVSDDKISRRVDLARVYLQLHDDLGAIEQLDLAVAEQPRNLTVWSLRVQILIRLQRWSLLRDELRRALDSADDLDSTLRTWMQIWLSDVTFRAARAREPSHSSISWSVQRKELLAQAVRLLSKVVEQPREVSRAGLAQTRVRQVEEVIRELVSRGDLPAAVSLLDDVCPNGGARWLAGLLSHSFAEIDQRWAVSDALTALRAAAAMHEARPLDELEILGFEAIRARAVEGTPSGLRRQEDAVDLLLDILRANGEVDGLRAWTQRMMSLGQSSNCYSRVASAIQEARLSTQPAIRGALSFSLWMEGVLRHRWTSLIRPLPDAWHLDDGTGLLVRIVCLLAQAEGVADLGGDPMAIYKRARCLLGVNSLRGHPRRGILNAAANLGVVEHETPLTLGHGSPPPLSLQLAKQALWGDRERVPALVSVEAVFAVRIQTAILLSSTKGGLREALADPEVVGFLQRASLPADQAWTDPSCLEDQTVERAARFWFETLRPITVRPFYREIGSENPCQWARTCLVLAERLVELDTARAANLFLAMDLALLAARRNERVGDFGSARGALRLARSLLNRAGGELPAYDLDLRDARRAEEIEEAAERLQRLESLNAGADR